MSFYFKLNRACLPLDRNHPDPIIRDTNQHFFDLRDSARKYEDGHFTLEEFLIEVGIIDKNTGIRTTHRGEHMQ